MRIGYARVSSDDQNLDLQNDVLRTADCERRYEDRTSGAKADCLGLKIVLGVSHERVTFASYGVRTVSVVNCATLST